MAIGIDNNDIVGLSRRGPCEQRRSPLVANTIFYPALIWTPRFVVLSGDPFDPSHRADGSSTSVPVRWQGLPEKRQHLPLLCREPLDQRSRVRLA
jgi:hypothetical protein